MIARLSALFVAVACLPLLTSCARRPGATETPQEASNGGVGTPDLSWTEKTWKQKRE